MERAKTFQLVTDSLQIILTESTNMDIPNGVDITEKKIFETPFDLVLQELVKEANGFIQLLDKVSTDIQKLEIQLTESKAYFPFRDIVDVNTSNHREPKESHLSINSHAIGYRIETCWYLSWEQEESTKKYRLFLISEESELIGYEVPGTDQIALDTYSTEQKFKKALSETSIATRLQYVERLIPFMNAFKEQFKCYRDAVLRGETPF